jgi:hypothetical protein
MINRVFIVRTYRRSAAAHRFFHPFIDRPGRPTTPEGRPTRGGGGGGGRTSSNGRTAGSCSCFVCAPRFTVPPGPQRARLARIFGRNQSGIHPFPPQNLAQDFERSVRDRLDPRCRRLHALPRDFGTVRHFVVVVVVPTHFRRPSLPTFILLLALKN